MDAMRITRACAAALVGVGLLCVSAFCFGQTGPGGAKKSLGAKALAEPCPVWVIASYDTAGKPNAMTASWAAICCSRPPCVTVSLREATYTYGNIMANKAFTVNIPSENFARQALYFGSVSGRDVDKFAASGLTPVRSDLVNAPYVKEFPLVIECKLLRTLTLGLHTMFIGEIVDVKADESILNADGAPDIEKLKPLLFAPGNPGLFGVGGPIGSTEETGTQPKK
jgi:flavin reductase (DIM6/NTAB) family NADH-FMN oxidoreductase RutF